MKLRPIPNIFRDVQNLLVGAAVLWLLIQNPISLVLLLLAAVAMLVGLLWGEIVDE